MPKIGFTWGVQVLTFTGCGLCILSFILHLVGFSCPEWIVGPGNGRSPFLSSGWHQACFDQCGYPYCKGDHTWVYDGCYKWTFNEWLWDDLRLMELKDWLMPDWWYLNRNLVIVSLPMGVCCVALLILCSCFVASDTHTVTTNKTKDIIVQVLLYLSGFLLIATAALCITSLTMWYVNTSRLDWMPMPEKNSFGYSYWLVVVSCILYCLSFLSILAAAIFKTIRTGIQKDPRYSEEMMLGK